MDADMEHGTQAQYLEIDDLEALNGVGMARQ